MKKTHRMLSLLLIVGIVLSILPNVVFASDDTSSIVIDIDQTNENCVECSEDASGQYDNFINIRYKANSGQYFIYKVNSSEAGLFDMSMKFKVASNNTSVTAFGFKISVGSSQDNLTTTINDNSMITNDLEKYAQNNQCTESLGKIQLSEGDNYIKVEGAGGNSNLVLKFEQIILNKYVKPTPAITDGTLTISTTHDTAEDKVVDPSGSANCISMRGGTNYNHYAVFKLSAPEDGKYRVDVNFELLQNGHTSDFGFKIGTAQANDGNFTVQLNNSSLCKGSDYATSNEMHDINVGNIDLKQGENYVKISLVGGTSQLVVNVKSITFTKYIKPTPAITNGTLTISATHDMVEDRNDAVEGNSNSISMRGGSNSSNYAVFKLSVPENGTYITKLSFSVLQNNNTSNFGFKIGTAQANDGNYTYVLNEPGLCNASIYTSSGGEYDVDIGKILLKQGDNYIKISLAGGDSQIVVSLLGVTFTEFIDREIVLDENNDNNLQRLGSVSSNIGLGIVADKVSDDKSNAGEYYKVIYKEKTPVFTYKPKLDSGKYEVFVYRPYSGKKLLDTVETDKINIDFNGVTASVNHSSGTSQIRYNNAPGISTGWYSLGTYEFTGTDSDSVVLTADGIEKFKELVRYQQTATVRNDVDRINDIVYNTNEAVCYFDAVKFVPIYDMDETNELIIDQTGRTALNPVYTEEIPDKNKFEQAEVSGYGYAHINGVDYGGTWAGEMLGSIDLYSGVLGSSWGTFTKKNTMYAEYYPRLTEGYYKVYTSRPYAVKTNYANGQPAGKIQAEVKSSFGTEKREYLLNVPNESQWEYLGLYHFNGNYGTDSVKLSKISGDYVLFDSVRFVRIPNLGNADINVTYPNINSPSILRDSEFILSSDINLDRESVNSDTVKLIRNDTGSIVETILDIDEDGLVINVKPKTHMIDEVNYSIIIDGIKDKFQREAVDKRFDFLVDLDTLRPGCTVSALKKSGDLVLLNSTFDIEFNEEVYGIDSKSSYSIISNDGHMVDFEVLIKQDKRKVTLIPISNLNPDTYYNLVVNSSISDRTGNPLGNGGILKFKTVASGTASETLTAQLLQVSSIENTDPKQKWTVLFSSSIGDEYINEKFVYISTDDGIPVKTNIKRASEHAVEISPFEQLSSNTTYRIVVSSAIRSKSGLSLNDVYEFSFKTRFADELPKPLSLLTTDGGTVETDSGIVADFSTELDLRKINKQNIKVKKSGNYVDIRLSVINSKKIMISPVIAWELGDYIVEFDESIVSIEGNALPVDSSFGFNVKQKSLESKSSSVSGSTATANARYNNNSDSTKNLRGMLIVYKNDVVEEHTTTDVIPVAPNSFVDVDATITNSSFEDDMYSGYILFEDIDNLRPASSENNNRIEASLNKNEGVTIDISGSVVGASGTKSVVYKIESIDVVNNTRSLLSIKEIKTDKYGRFSINYTIPNSAPFGDYIVTLGAEGVSNAKNYNFYCCSEYSTREINQNLQIAINNDNLGEIEEILKRSGVMFGISRDIVNLLSSLPNKNNILNSISSAETISDVILVGIANNANAEQIAGVAIDFSRMAQVPDKDGEELKKSDVSKMFTDSRINRAFTTPNEVMSAIRASVAIYKIKTRSTTEYLDIIKEYAAYLKISVPSVMSPSMKNGLYKIKDELTVNNFSEKFRGLSNNESVSPPPGPSGGGGSASFEKPSSVIVTSDVINSIAPTNESKPTTTENTNNTAKNTVFDDISDVSWANTAITYLYKNGIICGVADGKFEPNGAVTREQFLKMIVLALDIPMGNMNIHFNDVNPDEWYAGYIQAAVSAGIVKGYSDEWFGLGDNITREDMAVMVNRAINQFGIKIEQKNEQVEYADSDDISVHARDAINALTGYGLMNGVGNKTFEPRSNSTRAQAAKMVYELLIQK